MRERSIYRVLYVIFALGTAHLMMLCGVEAQRWLAQKQELRLVAGQIRALEAEVVGVREELKKADDPKYLEKKARSLGYVFPDEELHAKP